MKYLSIIILSIFFIGCGKSFQTDEFYHSNKQTLSASTLSGDQPSFSLIDASNGQALVTDISSGQRLDLSAVKGFNINFNWNQRFDQVRFKLGPYGEQKERVKPYSACGNTKSGSGYYDCRVRKGMTSGEVTISARAYLKGKLVSSTVSLTLKLDGAPETPPEEPPEEPPSVTNIFINVGSLEDIRDSNNQLWSKDLFFIGGNAYNRGSISIADTNNDFLYQTERYCLDGYQMDLPNGNYEVKLHFAETYSGITGRDQRVFDVNVEGFVISGLDIFAEAGGRNRALIKSQVVEVKDGILDLTFTRRIQCPVINAFEVLSTDQPPSQDPPGGDTPPSEDPPSDQPSSGAENWIMNRFTNSKVKTGSFSSRQTIEAPILVKDVTSTVSDNSKYAFQVKDSENPDESTREVGFLNVEIKNLTSRDQYGGAISTTRSYPNVKLYLKNVYIEPNWPTWESYSTTNYDGMVLDASAAIYAEDLTIKNWNADSAIDNKAQISQFVRLRISGKGHRSLRFWRSGPHYLVNSSIDNPGTAGSGALLWFKDCSTAKVYVYKSTFNGSSTVPSNKISCDNGSNPEIIYLNQDPRLDGQMHPMFRVN